MEDIKKKEEMAGGERITVSGKIQFKGIDITELKPSERARRGLILCPERRRIFQESSVLENLKIGGLPGHPGAGQGDPGLCVQALSGSGETQEESGRVSERRRAADAGHRPSADGATGDFFFWTNRCSG